MNHLILSAIADNNELRYDRSGKPICTLTCGYQYTVDGKDHQATLTALAFGDLALNANACPIREPIILQGEYERFKPDGERAYQCQLRLIRKPIVITNKALSLNCLTLVGRVGNDPDIKYFESGAVKAFITLAVSKYRDAPTSWHNVQAWGQRAEVIANYVRKGNRLGLVGRLIASQYRDRETGAYRYSPLVKAEQVELLERREVEA